MDGGSSNRGNRHRNQWRSRKGIGVSPGVVIGTAIVLDAEDLLIPKRVVAESLLCQGEIDRFERALNSRAAFEVAAAAGRR